MAWPERFLIEYSLKKLSKLFNVRTHEERKEFLQTFAAVILLSGFIHLISSNNWNIRKFGNAVFQFSKNFEKPSSNFEFYLLKYVKQYLDA